MSIDFFIHDFLSSVTEHLFIDIGIRFVFNINTVISDKLFDFCCRNRTYIIRYVSGVIRSPADDLMYCARVIENYSDGMRDGGGRMECGGNKMESGDGGMECHIGKTGRCKDKTEY